MRMLRNVSIRIFEYRQRLSGGVGGSGRGYAHQGCASGASVAQDSNRASSVAACFVCLVEVDLHRCAALALAQQVEATRAKVASVLGEFRQYETNRKKYRSDCEARLWKVWQLL